MASWYSGSRDKLIQSPVNAKGKMSRTPEIRTPKLLPPIVTDGDAYAGAVSPVSPVSPGSTSGRSRYHSGCIPKIVTLKKWYGAKEPKNIAELNRRNMKKKTPVPSALKGCVEKDVTAYLNHNKEFFENYVCEFVKFEDLERIFAKMFTENLMKRTKDHEHEHEQIKCLKIKKKNCKKQIFLNLMLSLQEDPNEHSVVAELARCITSMVGVDAYRLFKLFPEHPHYIQYFAYNTEGFEDNIFPFPNLVRVAPDVVKLVVEVAKTGTSWRVSRENEPQRFPSTPHNLLREFGINNVKEANNILYLPILSASGQAAYIVEMWRVNKPFMEEDEEVSSNFLIWGSLALHYCSLYLDKKRERSMSDFLLDFVKAIFEEMVSLDQLIKRILEFAQRLVNADRASLFLVDYRNFELVSTVFDLKFEPGQARDIEKKEIRMPINRGIAGHVALSGETMNIPDAYSDYRFNREVDEATGYKTVSILCMPIKVQGKVIGVVQMVNKRTHNNFNHEDEVAFELFSSFFGLALHHARLYDRIMRKEQKYKVALEVLSYHNTCRENEVQTILRAREELKDDLNDFYLDPYLFDHFDKCKAVLAMFDDLFDLTKFDIVTVTRFVLTVKKNYRDVPYHNFDHGWSVAHAMYVILKNDHRGRYDYKMRLALFVACLCHDLDHRGYTNKYMSETASPLAAMYTTSTLEHHHFNITVTILQQDGHNIFSHMSSSDYKDILGYIRHCILATDLAAFFPNLEKMQDLQCRKKPGAFSWKSPNHRELAMAITMTAADLSASSKPWDIQIKTVKVIFEEFYDQGDKEKAIGKTPIPMMDRNKPDEQPACQVGFLSQICIPCYNVLYKILPNTKPMYVMAMKNLNNWKSMANKIDDNSAHEGSESKVFHDDAEEYEEDKYELLNSASDDGTEDLGSNTAPNDNSQDDTIWEEVKRASVSWDEEEGLDNEDLQVGGGIWKNLKGTWIDDEGVVIKDKIFKKLMEK